MAKYKKVTLKQLRQTIDMLMRFLEEYQTVNLQNADAIVEYEDKVQLITSLLAIKKFDGLNTYSLIDLLNSRAKNQTCPTDTLTTDGALASRTAAEPPNGSQ
jgi:hypothetical protein